MILAFVVLAMWPAGGISDADHRPAPNGARPVAQDRPAPVFSRSPVTGTGHISLRALHGRVVVVSFWASWCTACTREAPQLRRLAEQERPRGVRFVGVDDEDTRSAARAFVDRFRPGYPSAFDPDGGLLRAYGGIGLPTAFILDRAGRIRYEAAGAVDVAAFATALEHVRAD